MSETLAVDGCVESIEELEAQIRRWSANMTAAEASWLGLVAEFDRRQGWRLFGCESCARYLAWQLGMDLGTANEKVRVARELDRYPVIASAMGSGVLPYAKVRAITRIANDNNVDALVALAMVTTANDLERMVTAYRRYEPDALEREARAHRMRSVSLRNDGPTLEIKIRVPVETGAMLVACMELFLDQHDLSEPVRARRADAVVAMAQHAVATFGQTGEIDDGYLVTLHLTPDTMDHDDHDDGDDGDDGDTRTQPREPGASLCCVAPGGGLSSDPMAVPVRSARRILCDAVMEGFRQTPIAEDEFRLGRRTRVVPRKLKRALRLRDGGCRFPGCTHSTWLDAHHIVHWLDHGRTRGDNLVCLCRRHHRLVHEAGWAISGHPDGELWFHHPDGTVLAAQPAVTAGDARRVEAFGLSPDHGKNSWWGDNDFDPIRTARLIIRNEHHDAARARRGYN